LLVRRSRFGEVLLMMVMGTTALGAPELLAMISNAPGADPLEGRRKGEEKQLQWKQA
jgi:hypothetical protein